MSNLPALIIFFGAVISAISGFWASSSKPKLDRTIVVAKTIVVVGVVISAIGVFWASQQQDSFNLKLLNKSEEIARLNQELANSVIGGDSFCYLTVPNLDSVTTYGLVFAIHQGEHNLYDVEARIVDLDKWDQLEGNLTFTKVDQTETNISIGNLVSHYWPDYRKLCRITFDNGNTRRFNIFFSARNGFWRQSLRFKKIHGKWVYATKVYRDEKVEGKVEGKVIYEKVDDEFPRTAEGNVEW